MEFQCRVIVQPRCTSCCSSVENIPLQAERHSARRQELFAFPPESAFTFRPECCSELHRNRVRLQSGIAFTFDRIPHHALSFWVDRCFFAVISVGSDARHQGFVRHRGIELSNGRVILATLISAARLCPNEQLLNRLTEGEGGENRFASLPSRVRNTVSGRTSCSYNRPHCGPESA